MWWTRQGQGLNVLQISSGVAHNEVFAREQLLIWSVFAREQLQILSVFAMERL